MSDLTFNSELSWQQTVNQRGDIPAKYARSPPSMSMFHKHEFVYKSDIYNKQINQSRKENK